MADPYDSPFLDDPEFQSLLVGCLESLQRGETIDRDALARDFPKFAEPIGRFLDDRRLLEEVASDFGDVAPSRVAVSTYANTMDSGSGSKHFSLGETVQYIGEYKILEEIARGGMGVVFKVRQQKLGRTVALKMILAGRFADPGDIERFYREARAAGRLTHSNIVPIHEVGEHQGRHYFTMDYVEGSSLAEVIRDETLSPRKAAELVRSIALAIEYAHEQGTVHRDLKPGNVLLDPSGRPKVTDFGLAKMLGGFNDETRADLTASGQVLGTPSYMSPEQASGKPDLVGPASDIYSLGAILYACLTGRAPFIADSPIDTLQQVMNKEPVSPRELNPSVPKDLDTICLKCLTKEPHKRYGTAQELASDLGLFLDGRPIVARPVGPIGRSFRYCQRNPLVAAMIILVFTSMAVGTAVASKFAIDATQHARRAERQRMQAEAAQRHAEEQQMLAEQARRDVVRSLYMARTHYARLLWERGNEWGASLAHVDRFFNNESMIADPDPEIEIDTLNRMIADAPRDDFLYFLRGIYHAKRRQWQEASVDLERSSSLKSRNYWYHCEAASAALMVQNEQTYSRHVQSLLRQAKKFEDQGDILSGANIALIAALRPQPRKVLTELLPFTERWAFPDSKQFFRIKSQILVRLRLEEYETVLELLEPFSDEASFKRAEHIVLASSIRSIALHHLDRSEEAKRELDRAETTYNDRLKRRFVIREGSLQATHHPFIQAQVILVEAQNLIDDDKTDGPDSCKLISYKLALQFMTPQIASRDFQ